MIGKKITNPKKSAGKRERIAALIEYVTNPAIDNDTEKCIYSGSRGFFSGSPGGHALEMIALAEEAVRSRDPVNHYVLSWRDGESPSEQQVEEAVDIFLGELGLQGGHQVVYGLHADTDNVHLHLVINRVHPDTCKCVEINKGFDIECVHRAVAKIEHVQGWQREQGGRYQVLESGGLELAQPRDPDAPRKPSTRARDAERRTGEKSAERIAIEEAGPVIRRAQSWGELHRDLGAIGVRFERKGSGAVLWIGEVPVKASAADRNASLAKLQRRLGPYQPAREIKPNEYFHHTPKPDLAPPRTLAGHGLRRLSECRVAKLGQGQGRARVLHVDARPDRRGPDGLRRGSRRVSEAVSAAPLPGWPEYIAARKGHFEDKASAKSEMDLRLAAERKALSDRQKAGRAELLAHDWKGLGQTLNFLRSKLAAEQAGEKVQLKDRARREREAFRKTFRPFPMFDEWRHDRNPTIPAVIYGDTEAPAVPMDIRAFRPLQVVGSRQVRYVPEAGGAVAFVDTGRQIDVKESQDHGVVLAALQLAAQKWGRISIDGNSEYQLLCCQLAAKHGIRITNPDLLETIERERARLDVERAVDDWTTAATDAARRFAVARFFEGMHGVKLYGDDRLVNEVKVAIVKKIGKDQATALLDAAKTIEQARKKPQPAPIKPAAVFQEPEQDGPVVEESKPTENKVEVEAQPPEDNDDDSKPSGLGM